MRFPLTSIVLATTSVKNGEVCGVGFSDGTRICQLVLQTGVPVPPESSKIHGISAALTRWGCPRSVAYSSLEAVFEQVQGAGGALAVHNAGWVFEQLAQNNLLPSVLPPVIDPMVLGKAMLGCSVKVSLGALCQRLGGSADGLGTISANARAVRWVTANLLEQAAGRFGGSAVEVAEYCAGAYYEQIEELDAYMRSQGLGIEDKPSYPWVG